MSKFKTGDKVRVELRTSGAENYSLFFPEKGNPYTVTRPWHRGCEVSDIKGEPRWIYDGEMTLWNSEITPPADVLKLLEMVNTLELDEEDECSVIRTLEMLGWDIVPASWKLKSIQRKSEDDNEGN